MAEESKARPVPRWPVYIVVALVAVFGVVFLILLANLSSRDGGAEVLTPETYLDIVTPLLVTADPERGSSLVVRHGCIACHAGNAAGRLAPAFDQVARVAAERRPPLTAAAYVYESVVYPGAFTVDGFQSNMPRNYRALLSDAELGHIIAYLLSGNVE